MRHKKIKRATKDYLKSLGVVFEKEEFKIDNSYNYTNLEIGCGKGKFILSMAIDNPNQFFIALEKDLNAFLKLAEDNNRLKLPNLLLLCTDAANLSEFLLSHKINKIFLNFSDPWPKSRHHKRRLTYPSMLAIYKPLLEKDGIIQFRSDHLDFFNDSIDYFSKSFDISYINYNLERTKYSTEYEDKKRLIGPIYQLEALKC